MEKYVRQLLTDLQEAKSRKPEKPNVRVLYPDHPAIEFGLDYIAEWEMNPYIPIPELLGIQTIEFPNVEKLTKIQIEELVDGILELWQEFNMYADFPNKLPVDIKYKVLLSYWNESVQYISKGILHISFCNCIPEECPFGISYCTCKDLP